MTGDDTPETHRGTPDETPVRAAETAAARDRGGGRSLARDLGLLSLVAAPQVFSLVAAADVAWLAFAISAALFGVLAGLALRWPPLSRPGDWRRQLALLAYTVVGAALLAYYVLVVEPAEGRVASVLLGMVVGVAGARVDDAVRGVPGPALS